MDTNALLAEGYGRLQPLVSRAITGLSTTELEYQPVPGANSIGWLVWHLTRVQDDHVAQLAGQEQLWTAQKWQDRFGLQLPPTDTGYGHTPEQVARVQGVTAQLLGDYFTENINRTMNYLKTLTAADLDRIIDTSWDPPVTAGVRLISVLDDSLQHVGQAAYVRGLLQSQATEIS